MKNFREDLRVNESILSKAVVGIYRFGHWVYYDFKIPVLKKLLWICYKGVELVVRMLTGAEIPAKCHIGKGLRLDHCGNGVVIHPNVTIGEYARIFHQVTMGIDSFNTENYGVATIGNNAYIGAGAKIIGKIVVGDNVRIGANAVVIKDVPDNHTAVGMPARNIPIKLKSVEEVQAPSA